MSTIRATNIEDRASGDSTEMLDAIHGSAKAWVNFNGIGTVAIRADYNVDSITDNSAGVYTVNFTNNMPDADYAMAGSSESLVNGSASSVHVSSDVSPTVSSIKVVHSVGAGSPSDSARISVNIFR